MRTRSDAMNPFAEPGRTAGRRTRPDRSARGAVAAFPGVAAPVAAALLVVVCGSGVTIPLPLAAQDGVVQDTVERPASDARPAEVAKRMTAHRVETGAVRIDGRPDEEVWHSVPGRSDFQQKGKDRGFDPRVATEVRIAYDDEALYVAAWMETDAEDRPRELLGRRDEVGSSERILVSLDTYRDRQSSFTFGVTVGGVRVDYLQARDIEGWADDSYDPVWEAAVAHEASRWTAEMRIPFSQLRFTPGDDQIWGLNIRRWNPATFLNLYWVVVPYFETGWTSRFGELRGIEGVDGGAGIEITPYVLGRSTRLDDAVGGTSETVTRFGGEAKVGLGSNLTLDVTANPDFGQVEADPARVNLSAFETFFPERRPFLLEGRELFLTGGPNYFYSRRIGSAPRTSLGQGVFEEVENTTVLGGAKVTGRLPSGLSVGVLGALSDRESVAVPPEAETSVPERVEVAPRTAFLVGRLEQEVGSAGSNVGLVATAVERSPSAGSVLGDLLPTRALAGGMDASIRFAGGEYQASGHVGASYLQGTPAAITQIQLSSAHWYQRPDADHVTLDGTRTSLGGWSAGVGLAKIGGERWLWDVEVKALSPGFDIRDAGSQTRADRIDAKAGVRYSIRDSRGALRNWSTGLSLAGSWNFGGLRRQTTPSAFFSATWGNLWNSYLEVGLATRALSDDLTRGGPIMESPRSAWGSLEVTGPNSNRFWWSTEVGGSWDELGGWSLSGSGGFTVFAGRRLELGLFGGGSLGHDSRLFAAELDDGPSATFGRRYVFSFYERRELFLQLRTKLAFAPDAVLTLYTEPFVSSGRAYDPGELRAAGSGELRAYGTEGTTLERLEDGAWEVTDASRTFRIENYDFWVRSFRGTGVFRWEWRKGSTLFLIWQRSLWSFAELARNVGTGTLFDAVDDPGQDVFAVKLSVLVGG